MFFFFLGVGVQNITLEAAYFSYVYAETNILFSFFVCMHIHGIPEVNLLFLLKLASIFLYIFF